MHTPFTPGPWVSRHFDQDGYCRVDFVGWKTERPTKPVRIEPRYEHDEERGTHCPPDAVAECAANAALIAAAPAMYDALWACKTELQRLGGNRSDVDKAIAMAEAALPKFS